MTKPSLRETQQTLREEIFNILTMNCDNAESIEWRKGVTEAILQAIRKAVPKKKEEPKSETWLDWDAKDFIHNGWNTAIDAVLKEMEL